MNDSAWLVLIYQMTDEVTQASAAGLLSDLGGFSVDARTCDRGSFVIVECPDAAAAPSVRSLILAADESARLIHSTTGQADRSIIR